MPELAIDTRTGERVALLGQPFGISPSGARWYAALYPDGVVRPVEPRLIDPIDKRGS